MKLDKRQPHVRRIREITLYIRAARVHHFARRRGSVERSAHAAMLAKWRDDAWFSWRWLAERHGRMPHGTPWGFYSCRTSLRRGVE